MVGENAGPSRPPATIEDFLWNMHQVLSAQTSPLGVDAMKDAYSKHLGHKCNIERWLVVSGGDLGATLKRIPHVVTVYQSGSQTCIKATQSADMTKEGLVEKDAAFRKELMKKSAAAKNAKAGAPPTAPATGTKASGAEPTQAKAPVAAPKAQPQTQPASNGHAAEKKAGGPTRPPSSIEDFLWNIHCVLEASESPMPIDSLTEAYSKHLGHKFAIERFLVVGDAGLVATLKRIPHVVSVKVDGDKASLTPTLPKGSTKESLVAADQAYRKTLQQKSQGKAAPGKAAPAKAAPATTAPAVAQKRPAEDGAESDAKRSKPDDKDKETLSRMLVQGVCKVLQNRATSGKGPLLISSLAEEFKTHWKVPFNLQSAGYSDVNAFLKAWPNKLEVANEGTSDAVVSLVKKTAEKAKAELAAPKTAPAPAPEASAAAKKAAPTAPVVATPQAPPAKAAATAPAEETADVTEPEAKKPRGEDQDTLSRMLVQGVVRVLQNRAKEGKGALLLSELPEEFKTLWKVPFNLQSAGFSDVNAFVKAWTNKLEVASTAEGDVVALVSKKSGDKAKAAAAKSGTEVSVPPKSPPASTAKASVPVAESSQGSDLTAAKETTNGDGVTEGIPQSASEIQKIQNELHKTALELDKISTQQTALVARQLALIEALKKLS